MQIKKVLKKSSFLFIVMAGILVGVYSYAGVDKILSQEAKPAIPQEKIAEPNPHFPKNANGETYGSAMGVLPNEKEPDLIKALGANGVSGYIRLSELNGEDPKTPEDALASQAKEVGREINVYESDGKTVIDKFIIGKVSKEKKSTDD